MIVIGLLFLAMTAFTLIVFAILDWYIKSWQKANEEGIGQPGFEVKLTDQPSVTEKERNDHG